MKNNYISIYIIIFLFVFSGSSFSQEKSKNDRDSFTALSAKSSGQKPAGLIPKIFASGRVSSDALKFYGDFPSDGKAFVISGRSVLQNPYNRDSSKKERVLGKTRSDSFEKYYIGDAPRPSHDGEKIFLNSERYRTFPSRVKISASTTSLLRAEKQKLGSSVQGETMIDIPKRSLISGALFVPTILTGLKLAQTNYPFNTLLFTTHKLTAVANLVLLNNTVYKKNKTTPLNRAEITATVIMNICFVGTMATGAVLSFDKPMPQWVHAAHRAGPWFSIISSGVLLYLLGG